MREFDHGSGDLGSIPGQVIPKTQKSVMDPSVLNTQHYKVRIKDKRGQSMERESLGHPRLRSAKHSQHVGVEAIEKGAFVLPPTTVAQLIYIYIYIQTKIFFRKHTHTHTHTHTHIYIYIYIYRYSDVLVV